MTSFLATAALALTAFCATAQAQGFALNVVGIESDGTQTPVAQYRWTLEEDLTYHVVPGVSDPNTLGVIFHRSYMPVVATGDETTPLPLDPAKHYFVSVLPKAPGTYTIGGAAISPGATSATVQLHALPLPTAQISVLVFEDNFPLNGAADLPIFNNQVVVQDQVERGLPGFKCFLEEPGGRYGASGGPILADAFGNLIGTTYLRNPDNTVVLDANGVPVVDVEGQGFILSDDNGRVLFEYVSPGKYGILCSPPRGENWQQTTTIEGTKVIDAWVKANEPVFFAEFGPPGFHVAVGFIQPFTDTTVLTGGETITGTITNLHTSRAPEVGFFSGAPFEHTTPWVGLNLGALGLGGAVYAGPVNDGGTFSIPNVPPGDYQLVIFDENLDLIFATKLITVNPGPGGGCGVPAPAPVATCDLGDIPVFQWFARNEHWVYMDDGAGNPVFAENGFWDSGEIGIPLQNINLRWRDGTIYQGAGTDLSGFVPFDEIFPFFTWLVAEVDYARYKPTGLSVWVDAGGAIDPSDPHTFGGQLNPQAQPENAGQPYRTDLGPVLTQGFQQFLGQTSVFMWGKTVYAPGENGGISGIVFYDTTRAEDEPALAFAETWQPGVAGVTVNLYDETGTVLLNTTTTDSWDATPPTGCVGAPFVWQGVPTDCYDGLRNFNQARPGVFDGGYSFTTYFPGGLGSGAPEAPLPAGRYVVEIIPPPGYKVTAEESRNVDFGDDYVPSTVGAGLIWTPEDCVGPLHTVPAELELFPGIPAHNAGLDTPLCTRKRVVLKDTQNAAADFFVYTEVPIGAHVYGFVLDDTANEFDINSPQFGEKFAPPFMPISIQDWTGREIRRVYTDEHGVYNAVIPSTYTTNRPMPSGMAPAMYTACINSPGAFNDLGEWVADPFFNRQYSQFCYTMQFMPGVTTYLDTPVVPVAAHAGPDQFPLDCELIDGTPVVKQVSSATGGPYVPAADGTHTITIESEGATLVLNPAYDGAGGVEPKNITRDYGFGSAMGTASIGGTPLTNLVWTDASITATVPNGTTSGELVITRGDNSRSTVSGITVTVGGPTPTYVPTDFPTIQAAIDSAQPNDLIIVEPGIYSEIVIMWKPVRLQAYGPGATTINAVKVPAEKLQAWRDKIATLITLGAIDMLPGQELLLGGIAPEVFVTEEGPGIMVLAKDLPAASGGFGLVSGRPNARIDGFTITGGDTGGAIMVNGFARFLEIANNHLYGNSGFYGGGIRVGHPFLINAAGGGGYLDGQNDGITIHHNRVTQNGGLGGTGGGISIHTGTDNYQVTDNWVCGNFQFGEGGGIGHMGLSDNGLIARNTILFNESWHGMNPASGGGVLVAGGPPLGGGLSPGAGNVTVIDNLIQGNGAQVGDGGGIRISRVNGEDVAANPNTPAAWYRVDVFNNMIVNNLAGFAAGGISLFDSANVNIVHNTIANNDSTATSGSAFTPGNPSTSDPQPAGVVSHAHSPELANAFGGDAAVDPFRDFSNPQLADNIIWHNRSFFFDIDNTVTPAVYGLLPDIAGGDPPVYDDLAVVGTATPQFLNPTNCILTDTTGTDPSNFMADPAFVAEYTTGGQGQTIAIPEATTILAPPALDEGGNFIRVRFGPLTLSDTNSGLLLGNYHLAAASPAVDTGLDLTGSHALLGQDFDRQPRPAAAGVDIGADERPSGALLVLTPLLNNGGIAVNLGQGIGQANPPAKKAKLKRNKRRKRPKKAIRAARRAKRRARRARRRAAHAQLVMPRHGDMFQARGGNK
ncbi:MAG: hypothetical protein ACE5E4_08585 [Candidatus Binatia bacterium]